MVGSYFVDVLFNHIYNASKIKVANNSSITDEYKFKNVQAYIIEIKIIIIAIHQLYANYISIL